MLGLCALAHFADGIAISNGSDHATAAQNHSSTTSQTSSQTSSSKRPRPADRLHPAAKRQARAHWSGATSTSSISELSACCGNKMGARTGLLANGSPERSATPLPKSLGELVQQDADFWSLLLLSCGPLVTMTLIPLHLQITP